MLLCCMRPARAGFLMASLKSFCIEQESKGKREKVKGKRDRVRK